MGTATKSGISWRIQRGGGEATGGEEEVPHNREHLVQVPVTCDPSPWARDCLERQSIPGRGRGGHMRGGHLAPNPHAASVLRDQYPVTAVWED